MQPCLYTTLYQGALEYMQEHWPVNREAWFSSRKRWARAADALQMPVLIRAVGDHGQGQLACTYLADVLDIKFREDIGRNVEERLQWLRAHKTLQWAQRDADDWSPAKFERKEIQYAVRHATHYCVKRLRRIAPIPLSRLVKVHDGERLAASYRYGYVLCVYPKGLIKSARRDRMPVSLTCCCGGCPHP